MDEQLQQLFDEFAEAEGARLLYEANELYDEPFPPELDRKCRAAIRRALARQRRKAALKAVSQYAGYAAIFAVCLVGVLSLHHLTARAAEQPDMGYYVRYEPRYTAVYDPEGGPVVYQSLKQIKRGMILPLIPDGYEIYDYCSFNLIGYGSISFKNADDMYISLDIVP